MKQILDSSTAARKIKRMAMEVAERNDKLPCIILIGIRSNGFVLAEKVAAILSGVFRGKVELVELELNKKDPGEVKLSKAISMENKAVLLVDDVANSGKTMLYALKPILDQKPMQIETLALIERTHKKFPVHINYVGFSVSTTIQEHIEVKVEDGEITGVWMN